MKGEVESWKKVEIEKATTPGIVRKASGATTFEPGFKNAFEALAAAKAKKGAGL